MMKFLRLNILLLVLFFIVFNTSFAQKNRPQLFLFIGGDQAILHEKKLNNPCVYGAQIIYSWKQLEPKKIFTISPKLKQI